MLYLCKVYLYLNKPVPGRFNSPGFKNKQTVLNGHGHTNPDIIRGSGHVWKQNWLVPFKVDEKIRLSRYLVT